MKTQSVTLFVCFVALSVKTGFAIKCFQCNSMTDPDCVGLTANHTYHPLYKECVGDFEGKAPFCRKISLTLLDHQQNRQRIIRTCGWEKYHLPCYRADNDDHFETVCQCFDDACNAAPDALSVALLAPILSAALVTLLK